MTKCVREIRDALGDHDHQLLKTVARQGFILDAALTTLPEASAPSAPYQPSATHNLPAPLTSFIGRQREIAELARLLPSTRLLTLTGAGGCGKTRLALEVARQVLDGFPTACGWSTWRRSPTRAGRADGRVGPRRQAGAEPSLVETLSDQLRARRSSWCSTTASTDRAGAELAETLLRAAPGLTIIATSREALGIAGETRGECRR